MAPNVPSQPELPELETLLSDAEKRWTDHDWKGLYDLFSADYRARQPYEEFDTLVTSLREFAKGCREVDFTLLDAYVLPDQATMRVQSKPGHEHLDVTVVKEEGTWRFAEEVIAPCGAYFAKEMPPSRPATEAELEEIRGLLLDFQQSWNAREYEALRRLFSDEFQDRCSLDEFLHLMSWLGLFIRDNAPLRVTLLSTDVAGGLATAKVRSDLDGTTTWEEAEKSLVREEEGWRLRGLRQPSWEDQCDLSEPRTTPTPRPDVLTFRFGDVITVPPETTGLYPTEEVHLVFEGFRHVYSCTQDTVRSGVVDMQPGGKLVAVVHTVDYDLGLQEFVLVDTAGRQWPEIDISGGYPYLGFEYPYRVDPGCVARSLGLCSPYRAVEPGQTTRTVVVYDIPLSVEPAYLWWPEGNIKVDMQGALTTTPPVEPCCLPCCPTTPSDLEASQSGSVDAPVWVDLRWRDNSTNEAGFVIERASSDTGVFETIATLVPDTTWYTDTTLTWGPGSYQYRVRGDQGPCKTEPSNTVDVPGRWPTPTPQ